MKITLTKPQHHISSSNKRFRVLISGRRFGKTYLAITEMMKYAALPNQKIWYVAPTLKMAKDICWSNLKEILNKFNIYIKFGCNEDNSNKTTTSYIIIK